MAWGGYRRGKEASLHRRNVETETLGHLVTFLHNIFKVRRPLGGYKATIYKVQRYNDKVPSQPGGAPSRGVGGLREALETLVSRGAFGVGSALHDSFLQIEISLGGLPPKGGVQRGKTGPR